MELSNKVKAGGITAGLFGVGVLAGLALDFICRNVSAEVISFAIGLGFVCFFASMIYQLVLARLDYNDTRTKTDQNCCKKCD